MNKLTPQIISVIVSSSNYGIITPANVEMISMKFSVPRGVITDYAKGILKLRIEEPIKHTPKEPPKFIYDSQLEWEENMKSPVHALVTRGLKRI